MKRFLKRNYLIIIIFILALGIRVLGVFPGYSDTHPDEILGYGTAIHMFYNHLVPNSFDYGSGRPFILLVIFDSLILPYVYLNLLFTNLSVYLNMLIHGASSLPQYQDLLFGLRMINAMYWARYIGAVLGALTVPLIFLIAKKLFNEKVGLFAAFLLAVNHRHILSSIIGVPDIFNSFLYVLAFFCSVLLLEKNSRKNYLLTSIACGFAFSIKYQFFPLLPFAFVHLIWALRKKSFSYLFNKNFILSILLFILVVFMLNPFQLSHLPQFLKESRANYMRYQMGVLEFRPYSYFYLYHWGIGEIISILILLGSALMFLFNRMKFFLLFVIIFPFFVFMTYYSLGGIFTRNFSAIIPFLEILAGYGLMLIAALLKRIRFPFITAVTILLLFIASFNQIRDSFLLSYFYSRPWDSDVLMSWLSKNLPNNITLRNYNLNLSWHNRDQFADIIKNKNVKQLDWIYNKGPHSLAEFQDENTNFAILTDEHLESITYWWRLWSTSQLMRYSGVPYDYIMNGFYGLSITELMNYTVGEIYKPWQTIEANNYLIFKIPNKIEDLGEKLPGFNFDGEMWRIRGLFGLRPGKFGFKLTEGEKKGVLAAYGGSDGDTSHLGSSAISVVPNRLYTAVGWIKNSTNQPYSGFYSKQDGFIRLDFYSDKKSFDRLGLRVAISQRAPLSGEWTKAQASAVAPENAKYMTVSFQRENQTANFVSYLSDLEIFEQKKLPQETFKELPYIKSTIPIEDLYSNTFL